MRLAGIGPASQAFSTVAGFVKPPKVFTWEARILPLN